MQLDEFIQDVARGAGRIAKDKFHKAKKWRTKTDRGDIVTEVDEECERYIIDRVTRQYPQDRILSEESGALGNESGEITWVIDPIDGTRNYKVGIPFFCVSIGAAKQGVAQAGAVYDPTHDEMFFAERGRGAYLNGERIEVSKDCSMEDCIVSVSWVKRKVDGTKYIEYIQKLSRDTSYFRRLGSAALVLSYVACGRIDGYLQGGLNPWDVAAGVVLIEEAGGVVTDFQGKPIDLSKRDIEIVTGNRDIHSILLNQVISG